MIEKVFKEFMNYLRCDSVLLITILKYYLIVIGILLLIYFIVNEINVIKRDVKKIIIIDAMDLENKQLSKDYEFSDFLRYNISILFFFIIIWLLSIFIFLLFHMLVVILLLIGIIIETVVFMLSYWIMVPVALLIIKYMLYKISLRYKK